MYADTRTPMTYRIITRTRLDGGWATGSGGATPMQEPADRVRFTPHGCASMSCAHIVSGEFFSVSTTTPSKIVFRIASAA